MTWIDVHTHIDKLEMTPEQAFELADQANVGSMITIGTCPEDLAVVLGLAKKYGPRVACTLGIHPHEAELYTPEIAQWILQHATEPEVVAIGETGLDYYYNNAARDVQIAAFEGQLEIAEKLDLPVEIHTRDAEDDTIAILQKYKGRVRGLLHCFTGTQRLADAGLDCGYNLSISGVVTFKNAESLRDVVRNTPLDRLHVETDSPFLAPVPHRGKKNHPAFVIHTAEVVAGLKGVTVEELCAQTRKNAQTLFKKFKV